jgi:hypothetical protein
MTLGSEIELGPLHFSALRILIAVGVGRVLLRGERLANKMNSLDHLMVVWAVWALIASLFHQDTSEVLVNRLGLVYNVCGIYFLLRVFCQSLDDMVMLCRITAILLVPLAVELLFEKRTAHNLFSVLGGVPASCEIRDGKVRANGPFAHSILAGTVGGVNLPLMVGLWPQYRKTAIAGVVACCLIVFASTSSGPIMSAFFAIGALFMWHWRRRMRLCRWLAVFGYIGLDMLMKAPAYYIIARIDLTGSSTSWHRAVLIEVALAHLSEWWFAGTDYTRHWLPYGVPWSSNHMLLLMADLSIQSRFMIWALGTSLFAHSMTFISVSYFDQSVVFIYLTLAGISSTWSWTVKKKWKAERIIALIDAAPKSFRTRLIGSIS